MIDDGDVVFEACGPITPQVTTNAAELEAMVRALSHIHETPPRAAPVTIWTDSEYVARAVAAVTMYADEEFKGRKGKPLANADRLRIIYDYLFPLGERRNVLVRWTKGHAGISGNERADELCAAAAYEGAEISGFPGKG